MHPTSAIKLSPRKKGHNSGKARPARARKQPNRRSADPLFAEKEVFTDYGPPDVARNHDKYLTAILGLEHHRGKRR